MKRKIGLSTDLIGLAIRALVEDVVPDFGDKLKLACHDAFTDEIKMIVVP